MFSIRRADGSVGRLHLFLRFCVALAVALLSVPLLSLSASAEDGVPADGATVEGTADPGGAPPPEEPAEEAPPAEEPAAEEPAAEEPVAEVPAVEEPEAPAAPAPEPDAAPEKSGPRSAEVKTAQVQEAPVQTTASTCAASFDQNTQEDHGGSWINGALQKNNSDYAEGDFVPHRVQLSGLSAGTHTLEFSFDRGKGGLNAYDFVANLSITDNAGATAVWDAPASTPPTPFADVVFVTITFTITGNDPTATILFETHIASELDYGPNTGAGSINGAPYHVSLTDLSCGNVGQQDNQLQAAAVDFGRLTIVKDAQPNHEQDFHFTLDAPNDLDTAFDLDDDGDGALPSSVTFNVPPGATTATEVNIADGWTLTDITCTKAGVEAGSSVTVTLADDEQVTCTFTNSRESSLEVDKFWVINGGAPVQEGSEPAHLGLGAQLTVNGANQPWDTSITGFLQGANVSLDESVTFGNDLCDWAGTTHGLVTEDSSGGVHDGGALPYVDTLGGGANHYTITNTVTCDSSLTLVKDVVNGPLDNPAGEALWTLSATPLDGGIAFASGSTGVTHPVTADSAYQLDEDDADPRYQQLGAWTCTANGTVTTVSGEQQVTVAAGLAATCTVQNATSMLVLKKTVQNPNGGTAVASDFTLVATPQGGGTPLSTPGSETGTTFHVNPGTTFDLTEPGVPDGYTLTGINCGNGSVTSVQVPINTTVTCTFTNVDSPGSLTLDKIVEDNGTGDSTPESAWHLSGTPQGIAGQPTIEGDGFATGATKAGTYVLDESGPATHTEGDWSCEDDEGDPVAVNADDEITLAANQDVTCEITNTAITPQLTLIKHVDPGNTGDETGADAFTLFAIPDGIAGQPVVSGPGPQVDADVKVGTYTLDEDGPSTYVMDAEGWTCTDAQDDPVPVSASDQFTIGLGEHITCEVTNNAVPSSWMVTKTSTPVSGSTVEPGDQINYVVTVTRVGDGVNVENIDVVDTLTGIDDAWVSDIVASNGTAVLDGGVIDWHIDEVSDTVTLSYTVTVGADAWNATLKNVVTPGPTPCPDLVPDTPNILDCDETTHFTPHFVLDKSVAFDDADADGFVEPGQELTYTLSMTNDSDATVTDAVVEDDLTDVLDNGTVVESEGELAAQGLVLTGNTLTWTVASLAPGDTTEATYTVLVGADQWDETLHNVATPAPDGPGDCIPPPEALECETTTDTPPPTTLTLNKLVDPGNTGDEAEPGDWTLTADPDGIAGQDDVVSVDGTVTEVVLPGSYGLSEVGPATYVMDADGWICTDAQDAPVAVTADVVTLVQGDDVTCEVTNNAIPSSWMVTKSSSPASGSSVQPGDQINYTVTVTRVGDGVNVEDIDVVDTLTGIDDAWVSNIVASNGTAVLDGGVIDWHIDEVADTVTLTYTVTVGAGAWNATLKNVVTPGPTPCPDPVADDPNIIDCDETTHFTPHFVLDKGVTFDDPDGDGMAEPGQELTYTLSMTNDSDAVLEDAVVTDDLSDVLDNGAVVESAAELAAEGLVLSGTTLTWTVASLAAGDTTEATYTVLIGAGQWDETLHNVATPTPDGPGECIPPLEALECETTTDTPPVTTMVIEKQNFETQEVLEGATFQLWHDVNNAGPDPDSGDCTFASPPVVDAQDVLLGTEITDGDGLALFNELQHGCYLLVESAPPPNYQLPEVNVMGIAINEANFVPGGEMSPIVITDFAEGQLAIVAKRQFELIDGEWVESDGEVNFGDVVKYRVRVSATGPKVFHNVRVTDYVPGFNPEDTQSTVEGTLREGSAVCVGTLTCTASVDADQLVTWDLGTLTPDAGQALSGTIEMIVEFPQLPDDLDLDPGETFTAAMWNVGFLSWDEVVGGTPPATERSSGSGGRAAGKLAGAALDFVFDTHTLRSNEVLVTASFTAELIQPPPPPPPPNPPNPPLPATGAQAYLGQLAALGGLVLALGLALVTRGRRKEEQEA